MLRCQRRRRKIQAGIDEIERLSIVSEIDADLYTVKTLEQLVAIRSAVDLGIHVVVDASLARGGVSERKLARAAGISSHTVRQWKGAPSTFLDKPEDYS